MVRKPKEEVITVDQVAEVLLPVLDKGPILKSEAREILTSKFNIGIHTAGRRINDAVRLGAFKKERPNTYKQSRFDVIYVPKHTETAKNMYIMLFREWLNERNDDSRERMVRKKQFDSKIKTEKIKKMREKGLKIETIARLMETNPARIKRRLGYDA